MSWTDRVEQFLKNQEDSSQIKKQNRDFGTMDLQQNKENDGKMANNDQDFNKYDLGDKTAQEVHNFDQIKSEVTFFSLKLIFLKQILRL